MARAPVDPCMFCETTPCTCVEAKPKPRAKALPVVKVEPVAPPPEPKKFVMKALPTVVPTQTRTAIHQTAQAKQAVADDVKLSQALTVLTEAELLGADDIVKYERLISIPPERLKIIIWKQRRREWQLERELKER